MHVIADPLPGGQAQPVSSARFAIVLAVLLVLTVLSYLDRTVITLMVDLIKASLDISDTQMGLVLGPAFATFFVLGSLPMGWIVDRFSKRLVIYWGVTFWSFATIACGLAGSFGLLLIARCMVGIGEATLQPASWAIMSKMAPPHRLALAISIFSSGAQIGAGLASLVGGHIIDRAASVGSIALPIVGDVEPWQFVFLCCGTPGIVLALLIFAVPGDRGSAGQAAVSGKELVGFLRRRSPFLVCHILGFSMLAAAALGMGAWTPTYLMRVHELPVRDAGLVMGAGFAVFGMSGTIFAGWLVDRLYQRGRRDIHLLYFAVTSIGVMAFGVVGFHPGVSLAVTVVCFFAIALLHPFTGVAAAALQIATPPELRGRVSALYILTYNLIGMAVGPSVVPILAKHVTGGDLGLAIIGMLVVCAGAASALLFLGRGRLHPSDNPSPIPSFKAAPEAG